MLNYRKFVTHPVSPAGKTAAALAAAALAFQPLGAAVAADDGLLQASYPTDSAMGCEAMAAEVERMDVILGRSTKAAADAEGGARAAELGAGLGINAALYSGALGKVPGLGMFANSAANAAKKAAAEKVKREEARQRTAETRRAIMSGLYEGKNCAAAQAVAAVPAQPAPPPVGVVEASAESPATN